MSNVTAVFKFKENKRQGISGDSNLMKYYHGNHIGMETLFQIDKNTFICRKRTNSQEKELTNSLYWLIKTSRQVVIFIYRQRTN